MGDATFTFRVEEELKSAFGQAAKAHDQTAAQLLRSFMRDYVKLQRDEAEYDGWFRRQVQAGLESADAGNLIPAEEVEAAFAARREQTRRRLDKPNSRDWYGRPRRAPIAMLSTRISRATIRGRP